MVIQAVKWLARQLNRRNPGICRDVREWTEQKDGKVLPSLASRRSISRPLPRTVEEEIAPEFAAEAEFEAYERFVATIRRPTIVGEQGFVVLPDGQFALEYITHHEPFIRESPVYCQRFRKTAGRKRYWPGKYFSVLGTFCTSYYHWMHDVLTQFHGVLDYLPADTRIIVPENLTSLQQATLRALGIPDSRLALRHPGDDVMVELLYFIPPPAITRFDVPETAQWLRNKLLTGLRLEPSSAKTRRLLLSRGRAACRRITNEKELSSELIPMGFEQIYCEDLTLEEQAALFHGAEIIVAPHGAGLTNLIFCNPGTRVLEIFPASHLWERTHYWSLAGALGLDYAYCCGTPVSNGVMEPDILVSMDKLRASLQLLEVS